nr:hypothetical protein Iba_chr07fCG5940 [Ipomoea batatas]
MHVWLVDSSSEMLLRLPGAREIGVDSAPYRSRLHRCTPLLRNAFDRETRDSDLHKKLPTTMNARVLTIGFREGQESIVFSRKSPVIRLTNKILELATSRPFAWKAWSR